MSDPILIYLIAGEPSGDLLAARLMIALRQLTEGRVRFAGIGGEAMREQGMNSLFPQSDLAVMGYFEVLPLIPKIMLRLNQTLIDIERNCPSAIVTIDSWGFSGRVVKRLKSRGSSIPRIHYVAPMVWAWKEKRSFLLAKRVDLLLCLLPNEPAYFTKVGLRAVYVGHAVMESGADKGDGDAFRKRHSILPTVPLICVLPGSRRSETSRLLPVFAKTIELLVKKYPNLQIVIPTVDTVINDVRKTIWSAPATVIHGVTERYDAFAACRVALAASGTVALELAMAKLPMVIGYRINYFTAMIIRHLIKTPYICLINLMIGRMVIPELIQKDCRVDLLTAELTRLIDDDFLRKSQLINTEKSIAKFNFDDNNTPSRRAASEILSFIKNK
ncbi:MAG: lipid-A-disaccharide synthase [Rhodospirillaceae bacterium]|jgi:lipid-A-disaccharide synthase|nr:lipid-A-disaccharide synthase [Rhodospirillaceae bacterium]